LFVEPAKGGLLLSFVAADCALLEVVTHLLLGQLPAREVID
jgi:hypothetical protein